MYLELIEQYYNVIEESFLNKDIATFTEKMNKIAYLALIKREFQLAAKTYNMMGHVFMTWKKFKEGFIYFKKLKDVAKMGCDLETSMYGFKQMGYCLNQIKEHHKAARSFKC